MMKFLKGCLTVIGGFVALGVVAGLILGGNGNRQGIPSASVSANSPAASSFAPTQDTVAVGVLSNVREDRAIQVNSSEIVDQITPANQFAKPVESKGGKLVVVYITFKNTGQESGNMFWSRFQLLDSQGRKYAELEDFEESMSINMWLKERGLEAAGNQMFPGAVAETAKVFRVAPDASDMKLAINNTLFNIQ